MRLEEPITALYLAAIGGLSILSGAVDDGAKTHADGRTCGGTERWAQKTLVDSSSRKIGLKNQKVSSITALHELPAPSWSDSRPREDTELQVHAVTANLVAYKLEADNDFHVVLSDDAGNTMIVEFADPSCVRGASTQALSLMKSARSQFLKYVLEPTPKLRRLIHPFHCTVTGPLFFDKLHGQTGVAPNGIEIHPVLKVACEPPAGAP